ncbi:MAG: UMP kinase [Candidatus Methanomethylophilaceae archaeon]|nr:UMP kinase [Candidatus Methanomethylophilaceae archaeon]MDD3379132.1 UMP kinase [Candidatus Methanomethylophilaceae archaeon]
MNKEKVVVSIGGSILIPDNNDSFYIKRLSNLVEEVVKEVELVIVVGGGKIARYYTITASELGADTYQQDMLGIGTTRLNAELLALALGNLSSTDIPFTAEDAASRSKPGKVIVMGGTNPGHTTDAVATMVAKCMKADRVVNATSVDAVYSDDPKKNPDAKKFSNLTITELGNLIYKDHGAGKSSVFDPLGIKIAAEEKIDILIVSGRDLDDLKNAILGKKIKGTFINSH